LTLLVGQQDGHPKTELWGAGMVICLERGADLHMAQLMPLPLTVTCFSKIQIGFAFLVPGYTHPFNGFLSGTTRVSRYQKGKTNLDFTEARDSEWQWNPLGKSAPRSRQITTPAPYRSVFYRPDALPAAQPTVSKH